MAFAGIPEAAVDFYAELERNNDRDWWQANKHRYQTLVREPLEALAAVLEPEFGTARIYRPFRDLRFSRDKTPYKTHQGMLVGESVSGLYLGLNAEGLMTGGGFQHLESDQLARYRRTVAADVTGEPLVRLLDGMVADGFEIGGDKLKTRPRDVRADHPRLELLRHRGLIVWKDHGLPVWLETGEVIERVRHDWQQVRPLVAWADEHIGPSVQPVGRRR